MTGVFYTGDVTRGWNGHGADKESVQKINSGEENSPAALAAPRGDLLVVGMLRLMC